jgi:hypothetical protein
MRREDIIRNPLPSVIKEIRKDKRSSWRRECQHTEDVPGSARLMRFTEK